MSDDQQALEIPTEDPPAGPDGGGFDPITSQEDFEKRIKDRLERERSKYSDYKDLKAKAAKFDETVKTADERIAAIETELNSERRERLKESVAADKGVPASALHGDTREDLEACADELISWRGRPDKRKPAPTSLKSGASNSDNRLNPQERAAAALRTMRSG